MKRGNSIVGVRHFRAGFPTDRPRSWFLAGVRISSTAPPAAAIVRPRWLDFRGLRPKTATGLLRCARLRAGSMLLRWPPQRTGEAAGRRCRGVVNTACSDSEQ